MLDAIPTANLIAGQPHASGSRTLRATNPATREQLPEHFTEATSADVDAAVEHAHKAWLRFRKTSGQQRAALLRGIADEIEALGEQLIDRAVAESGLPAGRITGERGRTCGQLRAFADLVEEGSWVDATIDKALPDRQPAPRADLRKMLIAMGPVAVFTASNFPLAFSTAGGDTSAALAAGCPVIVKAHPSHLGTNALVAGAIQRAVEKVNLPAGIFSSIQGGNTVGVRLVQHPKLAAVGFTGSYAGGTALMKMAAARPVPIPVYAEMGSVNPVFVLSRKLAADGPGVAAMLAGSVCLGAGQFCTNPGLIFVERSDAATAFIGAVREAFAEQASSTMLNEDIVEAYRQNVGRAGKSKGVELDYQAAASQPKWSGEPTMAITDGKTFLANPKLQDEVFGPYTLLVECADAAQMQAIAEQLHGQLTATVIGTDVELVAASLLCETLTHRVGRLLFNGVPTGVEVCPAMHHGGPFPAASSPMYTSVGVDAIQRFVRPICYQNAPESLLPSELRTGNPLGIWRRVNGGMVRG